MTDFPDEESENLIAKPFKKLKIKISEKAKEKLLSQTSGHPQLLQHACSILVDIAFKKKRDIPEKDVDKAILNLFPSNTTIATLRTDLKNSKVLENLVRDIFKEVKKEYHLYKEFSIKGAGPIVEDENSFFAIRNEIYRKCLCDILNIENSESRFKQMKIVGQGGMGIVYRQPAINCIYKFEHQFSDSIVNEDLSYPKVQDAEFTFLFAIEAEARLYKLIRAISFSAYNLNQFSKYIPFFRRFLYFLLDSPGL